MLAQFGSGIVWHGHAEPYQSELIQWFLRNIKYQDNDLNERSASMPFIVVYEAIPTPRAHFHTLLGIFDTKCILTSTIAVSPVELRE